MIIALIVKVLRDTFSFLVQFIYRKLTSDS